MKKRIFLFGFLILISFFIGIFFEKEKPFPYVVLNNHAIDIYRSFQPKDMEPKQVINDPQNLEKYLEKSYIIDTYSVPLKSSQHQLEEFFKRPLVFKGGLCIANKILFLTSGSGDTLIIDINSNKIISSLDLIKLIKIAYEDLISIHDLECSYNKETEGFELFLSLEKTGFKEGVQKYKTQIYSFSVDKNLLDVFSKGLVWETNLGNINTAGRLALNRKNQNLLISFDDRVGPIKNKGIYASQDLSLDDGKVLSVSLKNTTSNIFTLGHRTVQGLHIGKGDTIYSTEHGERGGDELNILERNQNYGWPINTDSIGYDTYVNNDRQIDKSKTFIEPLFYWSPSIGISNLIEIQHFDKTWKHNLLISSLKTMSLYRVKIDNRKVKSVEVIKIGKRIRDLQEDKKGNIFIWTDSQHLIKLEKANNRLDRKVYDYSDSILSQCLDCHHLGDTNITNTAPSLSNLFSREIASDNFKYSSALQNLSGYWDNKKLINYLKEPQTFAPGSSMYYQVEDDKKLFLIVDKLKEIQESGQ